MRGFEIGWGSFLSSCLVFGGCAGSPGASNDDETGATSEDTSDQEASSSGMAEGDSAESETESASDDDAETGTDTDTDTDTGTETEGGTETDTETGADTGTDADAGDVNEDGTVNILVIGTSASISAGADSFSADLVSAQLQSILAGDPAISIDVNVVAEDIHQSQIVTSGIAGMSTEDLEYFCHSLVQYYYWPNGHDERMANLTGEGGTDWDYVVIAADPHMVSTLPGYYALGVEKIAAKVVEGNALPLLLMMWSSEEGSIEHFEEFTYRAADGASVPIQTVPAGLAWAALPSELKDTAVEHPTPNGAYLAAAAIYSHVYDRNASTSLYEYEEQLADVARSTVVDEASEVHYAGEPTFPSPFRSCEISDSTLIYNHGATSTENGILGGLQWVTAEAGKTLEYGASAPIHFNYGRSSMGSTHLYSIDPAMFDFSFGYPLQDDASTGEVSMLYGLDKRVSESDVETDLGVARHMVTAAEVPYGRTVPLRTLVAQLLEEVPGVELYSDSWHMSGDLNKAIASYMYTMLTSEHALEGQLEPADETSAEWRTWMAHRIGYRTAWKLMYLEEIEAPP